MAQDTLQDSELVSFTVTPAQGRRLAELLNDAHADHASPYHAEDKALADIINRELAQAGYAPQLAPYS